MEKKKENGSEEKGEEDQIAEVVSDFEIDLENVDHEEEVIEESDSEEKIVFQCPDCDRCFKSQLGVL